MSAEGCYTHTEAHVNYEVILKPVAFFKDPFRKGNNIIVMCETYVWGDESFTKMVPATNNFRYYAQ
jgi:hypothetical protein